MKFFYLSTKPNDNGKFVIHERDCPRIPNSYDRDYLGPFNTGAEALRAASGKNGEAATCDKCCVTTFHPIFFKMREKKT